MTAPAEPIYWESIFQGNSPRIFKALYGSFLIRDWGGPLTSLKNFNPFDVAGSGDLRNDLIGFTPVDPALPFNATTNPLRAGWRDCGYLDENGVAFSPKYTTVDTMVWQSRMAQRTDVTLDQEQLNAVFVESTPLLDALNWQLPIGEHDLAPIGQAGYEVLKPLVPQMRYRQVLAIGVDGSTGDNEYFATAFSRTLMTKPDKYDLQAKKEFQTNLTYDSYPDPSSGWAVARWREGPAWRASGGTTSTLAAPVAAPAGAGAVTLTLAPPSSPNGPWTYKVTVDGTTAVPPTDVTVASQSDTEVVLHVAGQTTGPHTYTVQAIGANNSMGMPSDASNSVTVT